MNKIIKKSMLSITLAALASSTVYAVEPTSISLDNGLLVTPLLETGYKVDNNIFNVNDSNTPKPKSSGIFTVAPAVNLQFNDGVNLYSADFSLASGTFVSSSDDNYLDAKMGLDVHLEPSVQARIDLSAEANWATEARGTGITEGGADKIPEPLTYNDQSFGAAYEYGALSSSSSVAFNVDFYTKSYTNLRDLTKYRDFDSVKLSTIYSYSTGASTELLVDVSVDSIEYNESSVERDSDDYRALVGVNWSATALTSGEVKVGYQNKAFVNSTRDNFTGLSWDASVEWKPLSYSTFEFLTSRAARDPNTIGDYIEESLYSLSWTHDWNSKLSSSFSTSYSNEDYHGVTVPREDQTVMMSASADYALARWVDVSLFTEYTDKDSTFDNIIYDKTVVGVNFTMSM